MCGICGIWEPAGGSNARPGERLAAMTARLRHRGPDDEGFYCDESAALGLGFRRLAVVDLSREGHQPMASAGGRFVLVFNGEIYNHRRLRPELEKAGCTFRGHSDTEVMLAAIEHWGLDRALNAFIGMFAFALWDKVERTLTLVRDRLGIKPLYFGWVGAALAFASELQALTALPDFRNQIELGSLSLYLRRGMVPAPHSIYRDIAKLHPGTILRLDARLVSIRPDAADLAARAQPFWSARDLAELHRSEGKVRSQRDAADELETLLRDAVDLRMEADVPLGAFLSGGVDSSTVVALMQARSARAVKTFSVGFDEAEYDEAPFARAVARHLGTEHHEINVSPTDALNVVPQLPAIYSEPFADASQIPTYLVSQLAREHVTVCLSGDGGDELFAGYNHYAIARDLQRLALRTPRLARRPVAALIRAISREEWDRLFAITRGIHPARSGSAQFGRKLHRLADAMCDSSAEGIYSRLMSRWTHADGVVVAGGAPPVTEGFSPPVFGNIIEHLQWLDLTTYLPDDILAKVDRASMACSLEVRVPLLDHRVVELAWRLPLHQKLRGKTSKWLLRQVLYRHVPAKLIDRPKRGFEIPLQDWLRGPLRDWAEALLDEHRLREQGYFNPEPIRTKWQQHVSGQCDWRHHLWYVLMFQAWLEANGRSGPRQPA